MDNEIWASQTWKAGKVLLKPPEWYIVYAHEYVLSFVQEEIQIYLVKHLLEWNQSLLEDDSFKTVTDIEKIEERFNKELMEVELDEDIESNWNSYIHKIFAISGKALAGRTVNPKEIERLKQSFFDLFPDYSFLIDFTNEYPEFFKKNDLATKIRVATLLYLHRKNTYCSC